MGKAERKRDRKPAKNRSGIVGKAGLGLAVSLLIEAAGGGVSAAKACGMLRSRSLLYSLRDQKRSELTDDTIAKLQKGFDACGVPATVTDYLSSPSQASAQAKYDHWLAHWAERIAVEPQDVSLGKVRVAPSPAKRTELAVLVSRAGRLLPGRFGQFVRLAREKRGHSPERTAVAVYRVFEPLLEVRSSGYAELGYEELTDEAFARFVRSGLAREEILLNRTSDLQRLRNTDGRRSKPERRKLTNSTNRFVVQLQSGFKRKRPNIADALDGKAWPDDYPIQFGKEDVTRWIPRECWELSEAPVTQGARAAPASPIDRKRTREQAARKAENARFLAEAMAKKARAKAQAATGYRRDPLN